MFCRSKRAEIDDSLNETPKFFRVDLKLGHDREIEFSEGRNTWKDADEAFLHRQSIHHSAEKQATEFLEQHEQELELLEGQLRQLEEEEENLRKQQIIADIKNELIKCMLLQENYVGDHLADI